MLKLVNTTITDEATKAELAKIVDQIGFARTLEFIADYAHAKADAIRDNAHASERNLENDLRGSIAMVHLRQLSDHLEKPIAYAIENLE